MPFLIPNLIIFHPLFHLQYFILLLKFIHRSPQNLLLLLLHIHLHQNQSSIIFIIFIFDYFYLHWLHWAYQQTLILPYHFLHQIILQHLNHLSLLISFLPYFHDHNLLTHHHLHACLLIYYTFLITTF